MNSPPPHRGKVFLYKKFPFGDGGESDKRLILVNEPDSISDWIFIKTTKKRKKHDIQGCYSSDGLYVLNPKEDSAFELKTWVQFQELYPVPKLAMDAATKFGEIKKIGALKDQTLRAILNCMHKSEDLSPAELKLLK